MALINDVHDKVSAICPIEGIAQLTVTPPSWRIDFAPSATDEQRAAAQAVIDSFDYLAYEKRMLRARVDDDAERVRVRYITPGSGMVMTYQEKFAQAQSVVALGQEAANALTQQQRDTQFPTLSASVGIEAATLWDCAQLVLQKYAQFAALSRLIETARLAGKKAISDAPDEASARAAYDAITWPAP